MVFSGIYADTEFSWFLPGNTNIAIGTGLGGHNGGHEIGLALQKQF